MIQNGRCTQRTTGPKLIKGAPSKTKYQKNELFFLKKYRFLKKLLKMFCWSRQHYKNVVYVGP